MKAGSGGSHGDDFTDAHRRHWTDAELLYSHARWPNADHLYGLSAECGLKAVMRFLGMPADTPTKYRKHVRELWPIFEDFARGRDGGRYVRMLPGGAPFADWSHDDRYAHRSHFNHEGVEPHRLAAQGVRTMVGSMEQDGDA